MNREENLRTALLMCTCESYTAVAEASCRLIDRFWPGHPDLFIVGGNKIPNRKTIPFACDERDWIGMAHEASLWLRQEGFTHCYLILDDHPPIGKCATAYLNNILPQLVDSLGASHVALAGWDQFQPKDGKLIDVGSERWLKNSPVFKWKFDLHPGIWNISDFCAVLEAVKGVEPRPYSAREFEGAAGSDSLELPRRLVDSTFKIGGDGVAAGSGWCERRWKRRIVANGLHISRLAARLGGVSLVQKFDERTEYLTQYINGPYPMYWSGVIKKGVLNQNLIRFAQVTNRTELTSWLHSFDWPPTDKSLQ